MESNHVIPRYQRGAVTVWLTPLVRGLGSARTSPCRVSTGRSTVRASRPWGRRRGSNPLLLGYGPSVLSFRTSPACVQRCAVWSEGIEPSSPVWRTGILCRWTTTTSLAMDAREGVAPSPRCCQGGARTPAFRVTAGRLPARPPGMDVGWYRDGESNPGLRVEGPVSSPLDHRGECGRGGTRTHNGLPRARVAHGFLIGRVPSVRPSVGLAPTTSSVPRTCSPPELPGPGRAVSPARFERATSAFGGRRSAPLSYGELASTAGVEPASFRLRRPVPSPFGHVDERATDGPRTRDLRCDRPALSLSELRRLGARPGSRTQSVPG